MCNISLPEEEIGHERRRRIVADSAISFCPWNMPVLAIIVSTFLTRLNNKFSLYFRTIYLVPKSLCFLLIAINFIKHSTTTEGLKPYIFENCRKTLAIAGVKLKSLVEEGTMWDFMIDCITFWLLNHTPKLLLSLWRFVLQVLCYFTSNEFISVVHCLVWGGRSFSDEIPPSIQQRWCESPYFVNWAWWTRCI